VALALRAFRAGEISIPGFRKPTPSNTPQRLFQKWKPRFPSQQARAKEDQGERKDVLATLSKYRAINTRAEIAKAAGRAENEA
jgi:hypothetical protein